MNLYLKTLGLCCIICLMMQSSQAQQDGFDWRFGVGTGYMDYFGDLTPKLGPTLKNHYKIWKPQDRELGLALFLEKSTGKGTSLQVNYNQGSFFANDRTDPEGEFFTRALNFKTDVKDLSLSYVFRSDNGFLFGQKFPLAPYFYVGVGVTDFTVNGDLQDANGDFYSYSADTIGAGIYLADEQDGDYETNLSDLKVEKDYKQRILNIPFGVGLRFRTGPKWSVHLQTDVKYMFTDYLDDVSKNYRDDYETSTQQYAAMPSKYDNNDYRGKKDGIKNDIYAFTSLSIRYNFGKKKRSFVPPIFPPSPDLTPVVTSSNNKGVDADIISNTPEAVEETNEMNLEEDVIIIEAEEEEVAEKNEDDEVEMEEETETMIIEEEEMEKEEIIEEEEVEIETEVEMDVDTRPSTPAYRSTGGGYDPVVEMYKMETDRLRFENSDLKNAQQFDALKNELQQLKQMLQGGQVAPQNNFNQTQPNNNQSYNNNMPDYGNNPNNGNNNQNQGMQSSGSYNNNNNSNNSSREEVEETVETSNNNTQSNKGNTNKGNKTTKGNKTNQQSNNSSNNNAAANKTEMNEDNEEEFVGPSVEVEEEEKKGFFKRIFKKKDKKQNTENSNTETSNEETEKKDGFFKRMLKKDKGDDNTVSVQNYEFVFKGQTVNVNNQLKSQLKKIAKKAKGSGNKIIIAANTTADNEEKTNTIAIKIAQILAEDYAVSSSKLSYDIKTVEMSQDSTEDTQKVIVRVVQ